MSLPRNKMRKMNKRALSEVVAYVMLISMALALSGIIFAWLKTTATIEPNEKCDENIALIIKNYNCTYNPAEKIISLNLELKNQGLFTIEGYLIRTSTKDTAKIADITLDKVGAKIGPNEEISVSYNVSSEEKLTLIDIQPFQYKDNVKILCDLQSQEITGCGA
jgi:hypothetical protein